MILICLVITFGFFIEEVLAKFTEKSTNYMQSFKKVDAYGSPTITFCFNPTIKPTMKKHYNLSGTNWKNLVTSNISIKSMTQMFQDSYYHYGRDFTLTVPNYKYELIELQEGNENVFEFPEGTMNKIIVTKFHSIFAGLCYSATASMFQYPDQYFGMGLILNDSLKLTNDEPKKVEVIFTSQPNVYGIVRGTWAEGEQFETSLLLKDKGSVVANLMEKRYNLLSSPPNCAKISHYKCIKYGLLKVLKNENYCISTLNGNLCVNNCPKVCLPLAFQSIMDLEISNVTIPVCETGEENKCIATIMYFHSIELSKNCSIGCKIIQYKGAESGK